MLTYNHIQKHCALWAVKLNGKILYSSLTKANCQYFIDRWNGTNEWSKPE